MPQRDQQFPGRSRPPRTLIDDIRGEGSSPAGREIRSEGELPPGMEDRVTDDGDGDGRPESTLVSCPCCPAEHTPEMMVAVEDLDGPEIRSLPDDVPYICSWCDQHGRREGRIDRDVP